MMWNEKTKEIMDMWGSTVALIMWIGIKGSGTV